MKKITVITGQQGCGKTTVAKKITSESSCRTINAECGYRLLNPPLNLEKVTIKDLIYDAIKRQPYDRYVTNFDFLLIEDVPFKQLKKWVKEISQTWNLNGIDINPEVIITTNPFI